MIDELCRLSPEIKNAADLACRFLQLVRGRQAEQLSDEHRVCPEIRDSMEGHSFQLVNIVASALPLAHAVREVDAREDAAVEAKGVALLNDEIVEVRPQPSRRLAHFDGP